MDVAQAAGAPKGAGWDANSRHPARHRRGQPAEPGERVRDLRQRRHLRAPTTWSRRSATPKARSSTRPTRTRSGRSSEDVAARRDLRPVQRGRAGHRPLRADAEPPGRRQDRDQGPSRKDIVSAWFVGYTKQISTAVMYVAGDDGNGDLDDFRPSGRLHLLRRDLSGADLGRLHGDGRPRASRSSSSTRPRTSTATFRRRPTADEPADSDLGTQREADGQPDQHSQADRDVQERLQA